MGSLSARHLLAYAAVGPSASLEELLAAAYRSPSGLDPRTLDPDALADLARVIGLQGLLDTDSADALALYDLALALFGPTRVAPNHQGIHAQLAYCRGDLDRARALLSTYRRIPARVRAGLELDLAAGTSGWFPAFQKLFDDACFTLADESGVPLFDRLRADGVPRFDATATVSVVVTCFQPSAYLSTAVRSVVEQSWDNLEILIVDDGSGAGYDAVLDECAGLDPRISVIRLETNAGTYVARNVALTKARGEFVTFQDSDDWSHPRRIEQHVTPMLADPDLMATVSHALKVTDELTLTVPGREPRIPCMPSLMLRRAPVLDRLGYLDEVRKGADTEYLERLRSVFGPASAVRLDGVNMLLRQTPDSLSRNEFRAGWRHPARWAYQSAYGLWHEQIRTGGVSPRLERGTTRAFAAPRHLTRRDDPARYDVVFAGDWRSFGGPQKSMFEEIQALTRRGMRVGITHLEALRLMTKHGQPLCREIQEIVNAGTVDHVLLADDVDVSVLVIRYPPILQFAASTVSRLRARRVVILANQAPAERDGSDMRYVPATCTETARELFSVEPQWWPQGPAVREALAGLLDPSAIAERDMPGIIDIDLWGLRRTGFRSHVPVVGRHSRDHPTKWPDDPEALLAAYPDSPDIDVRVMGGAKVARNVLEMANTPDNWLVYGFNETDVRSFLHQLDFYVYFPHPNMIEAFGRAVLEALASGCVTILPDHFERVFGDAAVYCDPREVPDVIRRYYADSAGFLAQSGLAQQRVRERFGYDSYADLMSSLLQ